MLKKTRESGGSSFNDFIQQEKVFQRVTLSQSVSSIRKELFVTCLPLVAGPSYCA